MKPTPPAVTRMPAATVQIDHHLASRLLQEQAAHFAAYELRYVATGWDNVVYRLGEQFLLRLPRRELGEEIGRKERTWLPVLAQDTGLAVGEVLFEGRPTDYYPFTMSITRYVPGRSAATLSREERDCYAPEFSSQLSRLHVPASQGPRSAFRGCALASLDERTTEQIAQLNGREQAKAREIWEAGRGAEPFDAAPRWLHGDPHPHNTIATVAAHGGHFVGLVDFGDLCIGDPASDLGMLWLHFSPAVRDVALAALGYEHGGNTWLRARAWALRYTLLIRGLPADDLLGAVGRESFSLL
ncbi:aminoglycoside phosphotransferase family protein [Glutamicibacter endophyticus]|uniref:aminoglycoside phosphotransferase family protein n=1 Tax=Glutamicibacter endophyticus TaxID=1522174 RepID=UPI003AF06148